MGLKQRLLLGLTTFFLGIFIYQGILRALFLPAVALPGVPGGISVLTVILMLFSFFHATYTLGWRHNDAFQHSARRPACASGDCAIAKQTPQTIRKETEI